MKIPTRLTLRQTILMVAILFLVIGCQTQKSQQTGQIDTKLRAYFDSVSIPSAVMGQIDADGNTTWYRFGTQIWNDPTTVATENHIYKIYSMTKPIASVAAMQLVERGHIGLDEPLNDLMPEMVSIPVLDKEGNLYTSNQPITLRQLLTHTAGFAERRTSERLRNFIKPANWPHKDNPRIFEPGTDWRYGPCLVWAGRVVEKISGQDLETYIRENITGPLKMNSTWFNVPEALFDSIASRGKRDSLYNMVELDRIPALQTVFSAGGGMYGSPNDYLKFLHCILNYGAYDGGQILNRETVEMMLHNNLPENVGLTNHRFKSDYWGIGWAVSSGKEDFFLPAGAVYWAGWANTYFGLDPKSKTAVVYFSNIYPHIDREVFGLFNLFGREVYAKTESD
jgi:CubicO group peptidase (beta-lactamase class C family)